MLDFHLAHPRLISHGYQLLNVLSLSFATHASESDVAIALESVYTMDSA
jgi:hypothetical protein